MTAIGRCARHLRYVSFIISPLFFTLVHVTTKLFSELVTMTDTGDILGYTELFTTELERAKELADCAYERLRLEQQKKRERKEARAARRQRRRTT